MPRGGARPGAGRPRKAATGELAARKPRKPRVAKEPTGFTTPTGKKAADAPKGWPFGTQEPAAAPPPPAPPPVDETPEEPEITAETPLEFLLAVVKATRLKLPLRMQAAAIAAPFVHAKPAPAGKKDAKNEAAKGVGGKFAAQAPPLKLVNR